MIKYSIIVPVYNTEKYLDKCLKSISNQTYKNYEVIIVNDGTKDNSQEIIDKYVKLDKRFKSFIKENGGLSDARNYGVNKSSGDYLIFVDSDDYIEEDMLDVIDNNLTSEDVLRFGIILNENDKVIQNDFFNKLKGIDASKILTTYKYVEPAWCYVYKSDYYKRNNFEFKTGVYHEDFGLIPYIIYKADNVSSINYYGYHYVVREGSIITSKDYNKTYKKVYDMFNLYLDIKSKLNDKKNYLLSYMANCTIVKANELNEKDKKTYIKKLKEVKIYDDIITDNLVRKIKKIIMKMSLNVYLKVIK